MAYCDTGDLLTGSIPTPAYLDPQKYVDDAADEIDSKIGFVYETPIDISDDSEVIRPARLLLKRINVFLATGRLLMAVASPGEETSIHAYGKSLVDNATAATEAIFDGTILLDGATDLHPATDSSHRGPIIANKDASSAVDDFYDQLMPTNGRSSRVNGAMWVVDDPRYNPESWPKSPEFPGVYPSAPPPG